MTCACERGLAEIFIGVNVVLASWRGGYADLGGRLEHPPEDSDRRRCWMCPSERVVAKASARSMPAAVSNWLRTHRHRRQLAEARPSLPRSSIREARCCAKVRRRNRTTASAAWSSVPGATWATPRRNPDLAAVLATCHRPGWRSRFQPRGLPGDVPAVAVARSLRCRHLGR